MNFVETLRKRAELQPSVPALIDHCLTGDRVLTYSGFNRLVDFLSLRLREHNLEAGDRILVALEPGQEMYAYLIAALQIGAVPIVCKGNMPDQDLNAVLKALRPKGGLISKRKWFSRRRARVLKDIPLKVFIGPLRPQTRWLRLGKLDAIEQVKPDMLALISVLHDLSGELRMYGWTEDRLGGFIAVFADHFKLRAGELDLCVDPLHLLANLAAGLTSLVPAGGTRLSQRVVNRQLLRFKPTRIAAEVSVLRRLLGKRAARFHKIFILGAPLDRDDIGFFDRHAVRANIELVFGDELPLAIMPLHAQETKGSARLVGQFFEQLEIRVVPTPRGQVGQISLAEEWESDAVGELTVRGDYLPATLHMSSNSDHSNSPADSWIHTGRLGYLDKQGQFWLTS